MKQTARLLDLGRMGYEAAWDVQRRVHDEVLAGGPDTLILVEHDPVLSLGAGFHDENLIFDRQTYAKYGIEVVRTDRGGDVTYHGPGQLVAYPIFDLQRHGRDLHKWMRDLEEGVLGAVRHFGVAARRFPPHTGVWVGERKICALGVRVKRWVSMHGIAMNCDADLQPFRLIVPCGIRDFGVTSLSLETGRKIPIDDAKAPLMASFAEVFDLDFELETSQT